jgi:hypothetical protein
MVQVWRSDGDEAAGDPGDAGDAGDADDTR